jgi:lipid-binding SYLF domain-containing protein
MRRIADLLGLLSLLCLLPLAACGAPTMEERLTQARLSLAQVNTLKDHPTPEQMKAAKGVALLSIVQGGVGIGGEGGGGVVLQRNGTTWGCPFAVDVGAGTIGLQLGGQGKDVLLLFNSEDAMLDFLEGGLQLHALGEGTFGASTGNTNAVKRSTLVFLKGQGIFGGLELGALNVGPANDVNAAAYGSGTDRSAILSGKVKPPETLSRLTRMLDAMD